MKIVLATPLYPPDIAEPAPYVKELAQRLSKTHQVTLVAYGRLPEQIPGVRIVAIDKRAPLPLRLIAYVRALRKAAKDADVVYAQNGPSVELPLLFVSTRTVFHIGDTAAHVYAARHLLRRTLERLAMRRAQLVTEQPLVRPEVLPLEPRPDAALQAWEESWSAHLKTLERAFAYEH